MKVIDHPIEETGLALMRDLWKRVGPAWKVTVYQYQEDDDTRVCIDVETFETFEDIAHMRPFHLAVSEAVAFVDGYEGGRHEHA